MRKGCAPHDSAERRPVDTDERATEFQCAVHMLGKDEAGECEGDSQIWRTRDTDVLLQAQLFWNITPA